MVRKKIKFKKGRVDEQTLPTSRKASNADAVRSSPLKLIRPGRLARLLDCYTPAENLPRMADFAQWSVAWGVTMEQSTAMKLPWHRPLIVDDIRKSPDAAQLSLSTSTHRYMVLNRDEHEAELRKARVDAYRERQVDITEDGEKKLHPRSRCYVTYDGVALEGLVKLGQILDHETGDARIVGEALSDIIAEALTPENVAEALRQRERAKTWGS